MDKLNQEAKKSVGKVQTESGSQEIKQSGVSEQTGLRTQEMSLMEQKAWSKKQNRENSKAV